MKEFDIEMDNFNFGHLDIFNSHAKQYVSFKEKVREGSLGKTASFWFLYGYNVPATSSTYFSTKE